jgi:hypothetical protein
LQILFAGREILWTNEVNPDNDLSDFFCE